MLNNALQSLQVVLTVKGYFDWYQFTTRHQFYNTETD